jgi:hypothetical protein
MYVVQPYDVPCYYDSYSTLTRLLLEVPMTGPNDYRSSETIPDFLL